MSRRVLFSPVPVDLNMFIGSSVQNFTVTMQVNWISVILLDLLNACKRIFLKYSNWSL
jgi:hypothetical protein